MTTKLTTMRDKVIEEIMTHMETDENIFFLAADLGAPKLDELRTRFKDRFINVGIAEQNLINVSTGLALEGYKVFAYAIATFLTMRCFEQIRVNLALLSQLRPVNVNLLGVGAGISYDVAGPSHHSPEDISIIRTLPNIEICSPCDPISAKHLIPYAIKEHFPKYFRLDGKPLLNIYDEDNLPNIENGFHELKAGSNIAILSTGIMTQRAIEIHKHFKNKNIQIGLIDLFKFKNFNIDLLKETLSKYNHIISMEEGFINAGGIDSFLYNFIAKNNLNLKLHPRGLQKKYLFQVGNRNSLHKANNVCHDNIVQAINNILAV